MAFIEINPQFAETNRFLERIAKALERILLEQYNVTYGHCAEVANDPAPKEPPTVQYATDEGTARQQLIEMLQGARRVEEEKELEHDQEEFGI